MMEKLTDFCKRKKKALIIGGVAAAVCIAGVAAAVLLFMPGIAPVSDTLTVELGESFDEKSAVTLKNAEWSEVTITGEVDTNVAGTYELVFSLENKSVTVTVNVVDTTPPVLTLQKDSFEALMGHPLTIDRIVMSADDYTAVECSINGDSVDWDTPGEYTMEVLAVDLAGNETTATARVTVIETDETAPQITGAENVSVVVGMPFDVMEGVAATDDTDPEPKLEADITEVNTRVLGSVTVVYKATDSSGNEAAASRVITVIPDPDDKAAPVISGVADASIDVGSSFDIMSGVKVTDDRDKDPVLTVQNGGFNSQIAGTYKITYTATDMSGHKTTATRTVTVKPQTVSYGGGTFTAYWSTKGIAGQPYLVAVNRTYNTVTIYGKDSAGNYTVPVKAAVCTVGRSGKTPVGYFKTTDKYRWAGLIGNVWGQYSTRIVSDILFHSVPYNSQDPSNLSYNSYNQLGTAVSAGCVRLTVADAKWIYDNCPRGFVTVIYDSSASPGPLGKPAAMKIDPNDTVRRGWDPTDPNPNNPWHKPVAPAEPDTSDEPDTPAEPDTSTESGTSTKPDTPAEPDTSTEPGTSTDPDTSSDPGVSDEPDSSTTPDPADTGSSAAADDAEEPADSEDGSSSDIPETA